MLASRMRDVGPPEGDTEAGQGLVEYALIVALVVMVAEMRRGK